MTAYLLIEVERGRAESVVKELKKIKQVKIAHAVTGPYDVIAVVEGKDPEELAKAVLSEVHTVPGVARTLTCFAVEL